MVTLLAGIFIQEKEDKAKIRQAYGVLCGIVGIILNVCLFGGKVSGLELSHSLQLRQMRLTTSRMRQLRW